jgi:hypothetical protein
MANDNLTTATQNLVVSYGNSTQMAKYLAGQYTTNSTVGPSGATTVGTLIYKGAGRLVRVCVLLTDNTLVDFYDSAANNIVPPFDWLFSLDPVNGIGIYEVGIEFSAGLVMIIRGASTVNVTYSIVG